MFYTNGYRTKKSQKGNTRLSRKDTKSYGFLTSNPKRIISAVLFKIVPIHKKFPNPLYEVTVILPTSNNTNTKATS